jgi:hypothetical protein
MTSKGIERLAKQSDFDYSINGDIISIRDLDKGNRSVTNNIDNILAYINQVVPLSDYKVMYLDSRGIWDGVTVKALSGGSFSGHFFSLNEMDYEKAIAKMHFLQL